MEVDWKPLIFELFQHKIHLSGNMLFFLSDQESSWFVQHSSAGNTDRLAKYSNAMFSKALLML